jgi:carboxymethylenebutenolidase
VLWWRLVIKDGIMAGEQAKACVMYYGMPVQDRTVLRKLQAPVIFILARQDEWITPQVAKDFKTMMAEEGKTLQLFSYDADHAFANPSSPRYVEKAAIGANNATLAFLKDNMFGDSAN